MSDRNAGLMNIARQKADRCITWFTKNGPEGWRSKISVEILDQGDPEKCFLGQVFGFDFFGAEYIYIREPDADLSAMGVVLESHGSEPSYNLLTAAFKEALA